MDLSARIAALNDFAAKVGFDAVPDDTPEDTVVSFEAVAASYRLSFPAGHPFHEDSPPSVLKSLLNELAHALSDDR